MTDKHLEPIEGEIIEQLREKANGGVFIGTLNIMTQPARNLITEPLTDLYKSRYHGKFKRPKHVFIFDLSLIALGATLAAVAIYFSFFWKPYDPVQLSLVASPKNPVSGSEIVLNVDVANTNDYALENVTIAFKLPKEIKFARSSQPYLRDKNAVAIGMIEAKSNATERLVGNLSGTVGQNLKASANITYTDSTTGKTKTRSVSTNIKISGSSIGAAFNLPNDILVGQTVSGSLSYFNHGNNPVENVVLIPNWPDGFVLTTSSPSAKANHWEVGTLAPGSEGKINFTGVINSTGSVADFGIETGTRVGADLLTETQSAKTVTVTDPGISIKIDGDDAAQLGNTINLTAIYKNNGAHTFSGATLKLIVDDGFAIANAPQNMAQEIKPGATASQQYALRLDKTLPTALKDTTDPQLKVRVALNGTLDGKQNISIESPILGIKVASELSMTAGARYWSDTGDQLGRGPLPPAVGQTTRFWIFWNVKNTTGSLTNVRLTGKLPANVTYTGKAANPFGDAPLYDPTTRTMTWNVNDVPAWPGVKTEAIGAACEISFTPTADQRNTYATLMTDQQITGIDAATGLKLSGTAPDITTHLTTDPQGVDTGKIH